MNLRRTRTPLLGFACLMGGLASVEATAARKLTVDEVLQARNRPTMTEVAEIASQIGVRDFEDATARTEGRPPPRRGMGIPGVMGTPRVQNPPQQGNGHQLDFDAWFKVLASEAPKLIAAAEFAFPGATYAFIGRDSQAIADVFEAFYDHIGQTGRVVRLGLSKASFVGTSPETLVDFLQSQGLPVDNFQAAHPFILIDTVSSGGGRQGRMLVDAVYTEYVRRGGAAADLIRKFNMIGLVVSTFQGQVEPIADAPRILDEEVRHYTDNPERPDEGYGEDHTLLNFVDKSNQRFNEAGYEHFTGAWHASYGPMAISPDGKTEATLGNANAIDMRKAILLFQKQILDAVSEPQFLAHVKAEALRLGYKFSRHRADPVRSESGGGRLASSHPKTQEEFEALVKFNDDLEDPANAAAYCQQAVVQLTRMPLATTPQISAQNLQALENQYQFWLQRPDQLNEASVAFLDTLSAAFEQRKILEPEVLKAIIPVFSHCRVSSSVIGAIKSIAVQSPVIARLFKSASDSWIRGKLGARTYRNVAMAFDGFVPDCADIYAEPSHENH